MVTKWNNPTDNQRAGFLSAEGKDWQIKPAQNTGMVVNVLPATACSHQSRR
jgi:hypothetical protein